MMKNFQRLEVWTVSVELVQEIYLLCRILPDNERYGLISQMQRAAVSIPANIAEGYGRIHRGDYLHHLSFARGSLMELQTLLIIAGRMKMITKVQAMSSWKLSEHTGKMLTKMIQSMQP